MRKFPFFLVLVVAFLAIGLAACASAATSSAPQVTQAAPTMGAMPTMAAGPTATTASTTGGGAECVGVDTQKLVSGGQAIFADKCAGCHGENAEGKGDFPALAGNQEVTADNAVQLVEKFFSVEGHPKDVTAEDLASVLSYVRASFGNTGTVICPTDIKIPAAQ